MVMIAGKPHTQLESLNVLDELRVGGVLVMAGTGPLGPQIVPNYNAVEVTSDYEITGIESIIIATGTNPKTITLIDAFLADAFVWIKNRGTGLVTMETVSSQVIDGGPAANVTMGFNESITFAPFFNEWVRL